MSLSRVLHLLGRACRFIVLMTVTHLAARADWTVRAVHDGIVYFGIVSPARLERYDLANEVWLTPLTLSKSPQALQVDNSGIYFANQREVRRLNLDGTGEEPLYNASENVTGLKGDGEFLFIFSPTYNEGRIQSLRLRDGQFVDSWSNYYSFGGGYAIDPVGKIVYGITTQSSSFEVTGVAYNATGSFGASTSSSWGNGSYSASAAALFVSPNRTSAVRNTGTVYSLPSLAERGTLAGAVDDVCYYADEIIIALRGDRLVAFSSNLLAAGVFQLSATARSIACQGENIFAFHPDATANSGIAVEKVPFANISQARPGEPLNPATTAFVPDDIIPAGDDSFFLVSKKLQSIFRWDATTRSYSASIALLDQPVSVAYSAALDRLYLGYQTGAVNQIKLDEGKTVEEPFANRPARIQGLQALDQLVFICDESGAWNTFSTYTAGGTMLNSREWSEYSTEYIWSPSNRRVYHFRDGTSPNDIIYSAIAADGTIAADIDSPYHGNYSFVHPIRVSDDATGVLIGSGNIFSATDLTWVGALANSVTDAVSRNNRWVTIRSNGSNTQLQTWSINYLFQTGVTVPGTPKRLFELSDGRLMVFTTASGRLVFNTVDLDGGGTVQSSPVLVSEPTGAQGYVGLPFELSISASGSGELTYQWYKNAAILEGQTSPTLRIETTVGSDAGIYSVVVSNAYGQVASSAYEVTLSDPPAPPSITSQPSSRVIGEGSYFAGFSVSVSSSLPVTYQWRRDGQVIVGATTYTYNPTSNNAVAAKDYGAYDVVITDSVGRSVTSAAATLSAPTRTLGYSALMDVPLGGVSVTVVLRGGTDPLVLRALGTSAPGTLPGPALSDPVLSIYNSSGRLVAVNDNWSTASNAGELALQAGRLGLTTLDESSSDAGLYRSLAPGSYTIHVEGGDGGSGYALFEIYDASVGSSTDRFPYVAFTAHVAPGRSLATGVVFNNAGSVPLLVRGWGPATERNGALADPAVSWADSGGVIGSNDDWSDDGNASSIAQFVSSRGFSAFAAHSRDAALLTPTVHARPANVASLNSVNGSDGLGVLELIQVNAFGSSYNYAPPLVLVGPEPVQAVAGRDIILSSRGTERPDYVYTWSRNGVPIAGAIGDTVLFRNVDADDVGDYTVTVSGAGGPFTSMPVSVNVVSAEVDQAIVATHAASGFSAGGTATITVELSFPPAAASLGWSTELPPGWSYLSGSNEPDVAPKSGATGVLEWAWTAPPESPASFSFEVRVPAGYNDIATMRSFGLVQLDGRLTARLANPNPLILRPEHGYHRADTDFDSRIGLGELLRVIELYNYRESSVRTGRYSPGAGSVDGFRTGSGGGALADYHSADYDRDGTLSLTELLRVIEIYNYRHGSARTGEYSVSTSSVDGFRPGP